MIHSHRETVNVSQMVVPAESHSSVPRREHRGESGARLGSCEQATCKRLEPQSSEVPC